jgi:hypothetical protein
MQADCLTDDELEAQRAAARGALGQSGPVVYGGASAEAAAALGELLAGGGTEVWGQVERLPLASVASIESGEEVGRWVVPISKVAAACLSDIRSHSSGTQWSQQGSWDCAD